MTKARRFSPEVWERAVRLVREQQSEYASQWGATEEQQRLKGLERENREFRRANETLRKAAAYFAQAKLDRRGT